MPVSLPTELSGILVEPLEVENQKRSQSFYQRLLHRYYSAIVPAGARVLEIGCGTGDLLASLRPSRGVGIDFNRQAIECARQRYPNLEFIVGEASESTEGEEFDYIVMSDLVNDLADVQEVLTAARQHSGRHTRLVINFYNTLWRPVLQAATKLRLRISTMPKNWLSDGDMSNLLRLAGWELVHQRGLIVWPLNTPILAKILNRWVAPLLYPLCLTVVQVARLTNRPSDRPHSCSVIVPARNEAGNIESVVTRIPKLGACTEIIFVEGHSRDNTWEEMVRVRQKYPNKRIVCERQQGIGKGDAVRKGFAAATGEILFVLDADLTMPPEQLPKFYEAIQSGVGEFINGVRLVYPIQKEAMPFLNMIANKLFSVTFSWLLGQPVKDTLCGTKAISRQRYQQIAAARSYFGDFDPFGDFDLLFGAARLNLHIVDLPIRYAARTYGTTNIQRWRHGWLLLRMAVFAAKKIKFLSHS